MHLSSRAIVVAAVALLVAVGRGSARAEELPGPAPIRAAAAGDDAARPPAPDARFVHVLAKVSGNIGWDTAGVASVGALLGTGTSRLQVGLRAFGGMTTGGSESSIGVGGEAGHRAIWRVSQRLGLTLLTSASYMHRWAHNPSDDWYYRYHVVQGHVGVGFFFGRGAVLSHGVELGGGGGYAFHINPRSSSTDYSGIYGGFDVGYVLML